MLQGGKFKKHNYVKFNLPQNGDERSKISALTIVSFIQKPSSFESRHLHGPQWAAITRN